MFVPWGVVVCGLEDPIARRCGDPLRAQGLSCAPGRSGPRAGAVTPDTAGWAPVGQRPGPSRGVRRRDPHQRCEPQAWRSTPLRHPLAPQRTWCIRRRTMAVTRADARAPRGLETPCPGHAQAMARTTPAWLSRSSIMTLPAHPLLPQGTLLLRHPAWYATGHPTCSGRWPWCSTMGGRLGVVQGHRRRPTGDTCHASCVSALWTWFVMPPNWPKSS
jgi:hypothetical protein